jgi:hypothetical protein
MLLVFQLLHAVAIAGLIACLARPAWRDAFARRCIGPRTAVDLAWIRIVVCVVLIVCTAMIDLASMAELPKSWFAPPGYLADLGRGWLHVLMASELRLHLLQWTTIVLLALGAAGVFARVTIPLAAIAFFVFSAVARSFGKEFHEGYLAFYVLLVLACVPSGDALSWDARRRASPAPPAAYDWAVWACWAAATIPYLQLGFSKLIAGGVYWFEGASLRNYMLADDLNLTAWNIDLALRAYDAPVALFTVAGFFGLAFELIYAFVLVSPLLRRYVPAGVALLHLGVWLGQDALFVDATLIPIIFYVPARLRTVS